MQKIFKKSRHIRWNWEASPDNFELVRYHFVIIDDKNREGIINKILDKMQKISCIEKIRSAEGKVIGSKFRYLFETYDSFTAPNMINFSEIGKNIKNPFGSGSPETDCDPGWIPADLEMKMCI